MRTLLTFEKYKTTNYDVSGMRRYSRNILHWNKNDMKSTKMTKEVHFLCVSNHSVLTFSYIFSTEMPNKYNYFTVFLKVLAGHLLTIGLV